MVTCEEVNIGVIGLWLPRLPVTHLLVQPKLSFDCHFLVSCLDNEWPNKGRDSSTQPLSASLSAGLARRCGG